MNSSLFFVVLFGRVAFAANWILLGNGDCAVNGQEFDRYEKNGFTPSTCRDICTAFSGCKSYQISQDTTCGINVDDGVLIGELTLDGWSKIAGGAGGNAAAPNHPPNGVWPLAGVECYMRVHEFTPAPTMPNCDNAPTVPAALCKSTGDPHIKSFETNTQIHPQVEGDYVLFQNMKLGVAVRHARNNAANVVAGNTAVAFTGELLGEDIYTIYSKNPHVGRSENIVMVNQQTSTFTELCAALSPMVCQCEFMETVDELHGKSRFILKLNNMYSLRIDFAHPEYGWMNIYITADPADFVEPADNSDEMWVYKGLCSVADWSGKAYEDFMWGGSGELDQCDDDPFTLDRAQFCSRRRVTPTQSQTNYADSVANCDPVIKARAETYCAVCDNALLTADDKESCIHDACVDPSNGVSGAKGQRDACFESIVMLTPVNERPAICESEKKLYDEFWGICLTPPEMGLVDMEYFGEGFCADANNAVFTKYQLEGHDSDVECAAECNKYDECKSINYFASIQRCMMHVDHGVTIPALAGNAQWTFNDNNGVAVGVHPVTQTRASSSTKCFAKLLPTPAPTIYCPFGTSVQGCCADPSNVVATTMGGLCSSTGDPHIFQFNQQTGHSYTDGDYLLWKTANLEIHTRHARNGVANAVAGNTGIHLAGAWMGGKTVEYLSASDFGVIRATPEWRLDGAVSTGDDVCAALDGVVCGCDWDPVARRMRITFDEYNYVRWEQSSWGLDHGYTNVYVGTNPADFSATDSGMCAHGQPAALLPYAQYRAANCGDDPFSDESGKTTFCGRRRAELDFESDVIAPRRRNMATVLANCQANQAGLYAEAEAVCDPCHCMSQGMYEGCLSDACNMHSIDDARLQADGCTTSCILTCPPAQRGVPGGPCPCPAGQRYNPLTMSCEMDCGANGHTPRGCCPASVTQPPAGSVCQSTGDPHTTGFDGSYNHAYTDGDYTFYEGHDLTVTVRHKQHGNGVAGINALSVSGSLLGNRHFEYFVQTTNDASPVSSGTVTPRATDIFMLDGQPGSIDDICDELEDLTCKCGVIGSYFIMSFDEHTQIKTQTFSTAEGWMHLYLWMDPSLQDASDSGMCMYSGNQWSDPYHRDPTAYLAYRTDCTNGQATSDPFSDTTTLGGNPGLRAEYCPNCAGCRRRATEARDLALRRRNTCDSTIEAQANAQCAECDDAAQRDSCVFDACTMGDVGFAIAAADSCFETKIHDCATPACKRALCVSKNLAFDEASQSCMAAPEQAAGYEFIGWGYCQSADHSYFDFYLNKDVPTPYNTVAACSAKCSEIPECQSFEVITNTVGGQISDCYFNTDPDARDANLDAQTASWYFHSGYTGSHPIFTSAGDRRHMCYSKNPTPAPTPACPNAALGFSSLGCCPASVVPVDQSSHCFSWGDPHIVQFDGVQGHAYTDGDYVMYKGDELELYTRHAQSGATNGVAGNNAILVTGSLLGGHTVEFHAKTTNSGVRADNEFRLDGTLITPANLCNAIDHFVCKCEFTSNTFVLSWDDKTQIKARLFNDAYGWMDVDLQLNPTLQSASDTGMCTSAVTVQSGWEQIGHRMATAYLPWRTGCSATMNFGADPFSDPLQPEYCQNCAGCRRRMSPELMLPSTADRRRPTQACTDQLKADATNICQQCTVSPIDYRTSCIEDACMMADLQFARDAADGCFIRELCNEPDMPTRRNMCGNYKPGTQYHSGICDCLAPPPTTLPGYDFIGWGECRDSNDDEYSDYETSPAAGCDGKCNAHSECKSVMVDETADTCHLYVDPGAPALTGAGTFTDNGATSPMPVYNAAGQGWSKYCFEKQPTPAPTAACATGKSTIYGCCPNTCPMLHGDSFCSITGDPHVRQFDGLNGDIYVNGDFLAYKNDDIEIAQRSGKVGQGVTVAGNVGLFVKGSILGGNTIEIITKNNLAANQAVDPVIVNPNMIVKYNGQPSTLDAICTDLQDKRLVCHCIVSSRLFMFSINDKYFVRLDFYDTNAYGYSNVYLSANSNLHQNTDTGMCTRTGDRVQDGGANNVAPYPNDRYTCGTTPFTDAARNFYCSPANALTGRRRSSDDIIDSCPADLLAEANTVCAACDGTEVDTDGCVVDVCAMGDVSGAELQTKACKLNEIAKAAPQEKELLCEDDETFSKELDACVTDEEVQQILNDDGEVSVPTPSPTAPPKEDDADPNTQNEGTLDLSKTTLMVIAIMTVGILVLFALGIMIGQNCAQKKARNGDVRSGAGRQAGLATHNVQMTTTGETLPNSKPAWKEDVGSEFISGGLSPRKGPSSQL